MTTRTVPREITQEMLNAVLGRWGGHNLWIEASSVYLIWRAMFDAAPQEVAQPVDDLVERLRDWQAHWGAAGEAADVIEDQAARIVADAASIQEYADLADVLNENNVRLRERAERAEADLVAAYAVLPGSYYIDPPDGGDVTPQEQFRRMAKDAERYRWLINPQAAEWISDITGTNCWHFDTKEQFDSAIDAARKGTT